MMERRARQKRLIELVRSLPAVQVQNRLMASTDRDIALALAGMADEEEATVLAHLAPRKADRVREELALEERRRVDEKHIVSSLDVLIASLLGDRTMTGRRSYVRPRRPERG